MKRSLKQTRENLKNWAIKEDRTDSDIVNIIYWLYVRKLTELKDEYDFMLLYDNLDINCQKYYSCMREDAHMYFEKNSKEYKKLLKDTANGKFALFDYYFIKNKSCVHVGLYPNYLNFKEGYDVIFNQ